jgi:hypothetical protein
MASSIWEFFENRDRRNRPAPVQDYNFALDAPPERGPVVDIDEIMRRINPIPTYSGVPNAALGAPPANVSNGNFNLYDDPQDIATRPSSVLESPTVPSNLPIQDRPLLTPPDAPVFAPQPQAEAAPPLTTPPYQPTGDMSGTLSGSVTAPLGRPPSDARMPVFEDSIGGESERLKWLTDPTNAPVNKEAQTIDPRTGKPGKANFGGRLKDALLMALMQAGQQVRANGGVADWGTLGAAAGGGAYGTARPQWNEEMQRQEDIGQSNFRLKNLTEQQKAQQAATKTAGEIAGQQITNIQRLTDLQYDQLVKDPQWEIVKNTKKLTKAQAEYFNAKLGTKLSESQWQEFVEKTDPETGKGLIRPTTDPRYTVNPTISPDRTVPPVNVNVGNIPLTLKPPQFGNLIVSENQANAQRTQAANTTNANNTLEAAKANATALNNYNLAVFKNRADALTQLGTTISNSGELSGISNQIQTISSRLQRANLALQNAGDTDLAKAQKVFDDIQQEYGTAVAKFDAALGKTQGGMTVLEQIRANEANLQRPQTVSAPTVQPVQTQTVTPNNGQAVSTETVKAFAKQKGISYPQAVKEAKAKGYTIQ